MLGRLILEAGVLQVISPHGLVLVIRGAEELDGLLDGHGASVNLITTDPVPKMIRGWVSAMSALRVIGKESMVNIITLSHTAHIHSPLVDFSVSREEMGKDRKEH